MSTDASGRAQAPAPQDDPSTPDTDESVVDKPKDDFDGPIDRFQRWRNRIRRNRSLNATYRLVIGVLGTAVVLVGVVLLPLPGPGWVIIFLGLGLLATEFEWSRRLLAFARKHVKRWTDWVQEQNWFVKGLVGLGCVAIVAGALFLVFWVGGVPSWMPDWVPVVHDLPTR